MATWRLTTKHKKSFIEIETWKKGKLELIHDIVWRSARNAALTHEIKNI
jgi:hypothetical protein